jgi:hypothetical protein
VHRLGVPRFALAGQEPTALRPGSNLPQGQTGGVQLQGLADERLLIAVAVEVHAIGGELPAVGRLPASVFPLATLVGRGLGGALADGFALPLAHRRQLDRDEGELVDCRIGGEFRLLRFQAEPMFRLFVRVHADQDIRHRACAPSAPLLHTLVLSSTRLP